MTRRPLAHIRVLDFGHYLAGPLAGMMLADMGADVIRIDPPGGPVFRDPATDMLSRSKSSLVLNLKSAAGRDTAIAMVRRADVLIENFRPDVMNRLGLGPDVLRKVNDQLIYLSLPGFASTDPVLSTLPAWEAVIAARTGQFTDMGLNRRLMGINPSFTPPDAGLGVWRFVRGDGRAVRAVGARQERRRSYRGASGRCAAGRPGLQLRADRGLSPAIQVSARTGD